MIDAPYSWNKSIFVNKTLKDEKFDLIVAHEAAHISHKHYIDKFPPLAKNIKYVDFKEDDVWDITQHLEYSTPGVSYVKNIPVLDEAPRFADPNYKPEDIRLDKDFKVKE